jgi:hypothetical protein
MVSMVSELPVGQRISKFRRHSIPLCRVCTLPACRSSSESFPKKAPYALGPRELPRPRTLHVFSSGILSRILRIQRDRTWLFSQSKNLTPPTNYRTEIGYVLRCGEELTRMTPRIDDSPLVPQSKAIHARSRRPPLNGY